MGVVPAVAERAAAWLLRAERKQSGEEKRYPWRYSLPPRRWRLMAIEHHVIAFPQGGIDGDQPTPRAQWAIAKPAAQTIQFAIDQRVPGLPF